MRTLYMCVLYVPKMFSQLVLFWNIHCKNHLMHYSFCVKHHFTVWYMGVCEYVIVIMLFELKWYKFTFLYTLQMLTNICFTDRNLAQKINIIYIFSVACRWFVAINKNVNLRIINTMYNVHIKKDKKNKNNVKKTSNVKAQGSF